MLQLCLDWNVCYYILGHQEMVVFLQGKISYILDSFLKKSVVCEVKIFDGEVEEWNKCEL